MTLHLRPVGPLPASVYWRRRAAVLGGGLVLLVLLGQCGGEPEARLEQAAPGPTATAPGGPGPTDPAPTDVPASPAATPAPPVACTDAGLRVSATPQRAQYAVGGRPVLRLAIRNAGTAPCVRELGQGAVELTVFSGRDRIWSSDDCAPGGELGPVTLAPQELRVITVTWNARRSRPGCPDGAEAIEPGTYRVVGRVGTLTTPATAGFRVTG